MTLRRVVLAGLLLVGFLAPAAAKPSLSAERAKLKIPPDWIATTRVDYDMSKPWKDARLRIRELLGEGRNREAITLMWRYKQKGDIGDGHEYPMYTHLGREFCWSVVAHEEWLAAQKRRADFKGATHAFVTLASLYRYYGEYARAAAQLDDALRYLPDPPWRIAQTANIHEARGDLYADQGKFAEAKASYTRAADLLPTSDQPYGRHLLKRQADKIRSKIERLDRRTLDLRQLRDGSFKATSIGYNGDVTVTITLKGGRLTDVKVDHQEKIEQGATRSVPRQLIERQSLEVDAVTGATVTVDALLEGTLMALKQAGLK